MKLLLCTHCKDIFNLKREIKTCSCGKSSGVYSDDGVHACYSGEGIPFGFANHSFYAAVSQHPSLTIHSERGIPFRAFIIPPCPSVIRVRNLSELAKWSRRNRPSRMGKVNIQTRLLRG